MTRTAGGLIDVGGHRLYLQSRGEGPPTVVFENGLGASLEEWALVLPQVAGFCRACAYDRTGLGRSEESGTPRDAQQMAQELHALLTTAGVPGPYVLVGHSLGGLLIRMFAHLYPDEVAALVMVDSSHPEQSRRFPPQRWAFLAFWLASAATLLARVHIDVYRRLALRSLDVEEFPPEDLDVMASHYASPRHLSAVQRELKALDVILAEGRMLGDLGDRPLVVLTATVGQPHIRAVMDPLHAELAQLSSRGIHRRVEGAAHVSIVTLRQYAQVVVEAIREVVEQVRAG